MQFNRIALVTLLILFSSASSWAQKITAKEPPKEKTPEEIRKMVEAAKVQPPSGPMLVISPIGETGGLFSVSLQDEQRIVATSYTQWQVSAIEAIMIEAKKFAHSDQNVGVKKHIITRFFVSKEPSFFVDVLKLGDQSRFFITIKSPTDKLTLDAGSIKRGDAQANPLFYEFLSRIQAARSGPQNPQ